MTRAAKTTAGKRVAVFFDDPRFEDYPFSDADFRKAYYELAAGLRAKDAEVWIVRDQKTYAGGCSFEGGWKFDGAEFVRDESTIEADVVFNKGHLQADGGACLVNSQALEDFCTDKWKTFETFPALSPDSVLARDKMELAAALKKFPDMVTVKPVDGWRGLDVHIGKAADIEAKVKEFPAIVQEFVDTSSGIPGITPGLHDLRMIGVNGKLIYAYVRVPPPKSFVSNYAQGGKWFEVPVKDLPKSAVQVFDEVDASMKRFGFRIYSVDVGLHRGKEWKIFELNSKPALDSRGTYPGAGVFMDAVIDALLSA